MPIHCVGRRKHLSFFKKIETEKNCPKLVYPNISAPPKIIIELPLVSFYTKQMISGIRVTGSTVTTWSYVVYFLKKRVYIIHLQHIVDFFAFLWDLHLACHKYEQLSLHTPMDTSQRIKLARFYIFKSNTRKPLSQHCHRYLTLAAFPIAFHLPSKNFSFLHLFEYDHLA